jgi:hypothetical protein
MLLLLGFEPVSAGYCTRSIEMQHDTIAFSIVASRPESMRTLACLLVSLTLASPLPVLAQGIGNPDYDQCILQSLRDSQSTIAANAIRRSCEALYKNGALLLPRERSYHVCVLENLQSVRGQFAIQQILRACQRQNQM